MTLGTLLRSTPRDVVRLARWLERQGEWCWIEPGKDDRFGRLCDAVAMQSYLHRLRGPSSY